LREASRRKVHTCSSLTCISSQALPSQSRLTRPTPPPPIPIRSCRLPLRRLIGGMFNEDRYSWRTSSGTSPPRNAQCSNEVSSTRPAEQICSLTERTGGSGGKESCAQVRSDEIDASRAGPQGHEAESKPCEREAALSQIYSRTVEGGRHPDYGWRHSPTDQGFARVGGGTLEELSAGPQHGTFISRTDRSGITERSFWLPARASAVHQLTRRGRPHY